jgi:hypothetical protein
MDILLVNFYDVEDENRRLRLENEALKRNDDRYEAMLKQHKDNWERMKGRPEPAVDAQEQDLSPTGDDGDGMATSQILHGRRADRRTDKSRTE